jgi:hypothetical protein
LDIKAENGTFRVLLARKDMKGSANLDVFIVRVSSQVAEPHLAGDAAARIVASRRALIRFDVPARRPGAGLNIEWESFKASKHAYRAAHADVLFHLDTLSEPVLFLNKDADPDLKTILTDDVPEVIRPPCNVLCSDVSCRTCLLRTAISALIPMATWNLDGKATSNKRDRCRS